MAGRRFESAQAWSGGGKATPMKRQRPARAADLRADVAVPFLQAALTGGLAAGVITALWWGISAPDASAIVVWSGLALGITTVVWLILLGQTRRLLWAVERAVGEDLDGDGAVGRPQKPEERLVVVNAAAARREAENREAAERRSEFAQFVAALEARGTSQRAWEPVIGRERWAYYRDTLIRLGWADWNVRRNGRPVKGRGWRLLLPVEEILARIDG